jgi:putative sigma-54 modulation protein
VEITITGRHVDLTKGINDYVKKKFKKVEGYFDFKENGALHIVITVEKYRHTAEAILHGKKHNFAAKVESKDMYSSIDLLEDKLMAQIKKHKDKLDKPVKGKTRVSSSNILATLSSASSAKGDQYNEIIEEELQALKPMNTEEAMEEVEISPEKILLFFNVDFNKACLIRKRKDKKYGLTISKY